MNAIVIYSTHRGNTEKVAQEIAGTVNCKAIKLTENFDASTLSLDTCDLVFLGTGIRGGEPYIELLNYLNAVQLKNSGRFVLFITWAGGGASNRLTYERIKQTLEAKGQQLSENYFICLGQFGFTRRGRPNIGDLAAARKWATEQINNP